MRRQTPPTILVWAPIALLAGCASYEPAPVNPEEILEQLEAVEWPPSPDDSGAADSPTSSENDVGPRQLAAFGVSTNPRLQAVRAELGVRQALLVEAGLLPDPSIGWDAMDVLAAEIEGDGATSEDVVAGLGITFPLLRPGERDGSIGAAEARLEEARGLVSTAEWQLATAICVAFEEVRTAERLHAQSLALMEVVRATYEYIRDAREAGTVTAIQENLALSQLQALQLDVLGAESRVEQSRLYLNGLLGLPPETVLSLQFDYADPIETLLTGKLESGIGGLVAQAVRTRPDIVAQTLRYRVAEEELRLAYSKQYPLVSIGTGISFSLPVFSKFGRPEIQTALARRERVRQELVSTIHVARQEISAAFADWRVARRELEFVEGTMLPTAEANRALSSEALGLGAVTLLETLAIQKSLIEARTRYSNLRGAAAVRSWELLAASGRLLVDSGQDWPTPKEAGR